MILYAEYMCCMNQFPNMTSCYPNLTSATGTTSGKQKTAKVHIFYGNSNEIGMSDTHKRSNVPKCHFFTQGKCTRGASCRFSHTNATSAHPTTRSKNVPERVDFPFLCNPTKSPITKVTVPYNQVASTSLPEEKPRLPYVKQKHMVVIYRPVKNGKLVLT